MGFSQDSSRPLMAPSLTSDEDSSHHRSSSGFSSLILTYSHSSIDSAQQEFYEIEAVMEKLENKKLSTQRFIPTQEKVEYLNKLAFSAKLERALERRMIGQDAEMRVRTSEETIGEKTEKLIFV